MDGESVRFGGGGVSLPSDLEAALGGQWSSAPVSRRDALRVPAVLRARNLIAGVPATLPLELRNADRELDGRDWLGVQPNPDVESTFVWASTFEDLLFNGVSWWRVLGVGFGQFPVSAERLLPQTVAPVPAMSGLTQNLSDDLLFPAGGIVFVDGRPARLSRPGVAAVPGDVIRFVSPNPPLLTAAAGAIRTVLLLDRIAADYASDPLPFGYFKDSADAEPLDDEAVLEMLGRWERARQSRRWGYVESGLELVRLEWPTPSQLQLVEARQHAVLEIARATGLDPTEVGAPPAGSSLTYQNVEQRRQDLIDFTVAPYLSAVEDRMSMGDITPRGLRAKWRVSEFTRADTRSRIETYAAAIAAGIMTVDEARELEGWPDMPASDRPDVSPVPVPAGLNGNGSVNGRR